MACRSTRQSLFWSFLLTLLVIFGEVNGAMGDPAEQRVQIGLRLFRTLVAADQDLEDKTDAEGRLELALLYQNDRNQAEMLAEALRESGHGNEQGKIKNHPLRTVPVDLDTLKRLQPVPAAIYLVQPLPKPDLASVIRYGVDHHRIVFSPFEGQVEQGVLAGLAIEVRVMPHINQTTLRQSGIRLKELLLKVAKIHE
ncbi:MAG: hypothetical protein H6969_06095 [Gammaproteobacteria bacterium]|nr:hypothetical protein [Gammaproteobacteria bacterium]